MTALKYLDAGLLCTIEGILDGVPTCVEELEALEEGLGQLEDVLSTAPISEAELEEFGLHIEG